MSFAQVFLAENFTFYNYDRCDRTLRTRCIHDSLLTTRDAQFSPLNPSVFAVEMEEAASIFYWLSPASIYSTVYATVLSLKSPKWFLEPEFQI